MRLLSKIKDMNGRWAGLFCETLCVFDHHMLYILSLFFETVGEFSLRILSFFRFGIAVLRNSLRFLRYCNKGSTLKKQRVS